MFCTNCGRQQSVGSVFCTNCGAQLTAGSPNSGARPIRRPITKAEYFSGCCSGEAKQKIKNIKTMGWIGLAIQWVLAVVGIVVTMAFAEALESSDFYSGGATEVFLILDGVLVLFVGLSSFFTLKGMKESRTGFLIAAIFFAVFGTLLGAAFVVAVLVRQILGLGMLALYIVMIVFSCQINGEYKAYLQRNFMR